MAKYKQSKTILGEWIKYIIWFESLAICLFRAHHAFNHFNSVFLAKVKQLYGG
jgi:hypothetical protein